MLLSLVKSIHLKEHLFTILFLGQGYIFTGVGDSVHRGGMRGREGRVWPGGVCGRGAAWPGGVHGGGHAW